MRRKPWIVAVLLALVVTGTVVWATLPRGSAANPNAIVSAATMFRGTVMKTPIQPSSRKTGSSTK